MYVRRKPTGAGPTDKVLLAQAGEKRLSADAGELAEIVEFRALPFEGELPKRRIAH